MPLWEAPGALALGLTLPAILLLYLLRRRRPRRRVSSLLLWPPAPPDQAANAPWQRLRPRLILWLQLLLALLLTLAAARPLWAGGGLGGGLHRVVLLDASGSMRATDVEPTRFAAAVAAVREMAADLGPRDRLTVIRVESEPQVLVAGATGARPVTEALAGQEPGYGEADLAAALAVAGAVTGEEAAEWVLVTDGGLSLPSDFAPPPGVRLRQVTVGSHGRNVALTGLQLGESDGRLVAQVGVANLGDRPVAGRVALVGLGPGGPVPLGSQPFAAGPGETAYLTWPDLPPAEAFRAELAGLDPGENALAHDDVAVAVPAAGERPRVLLVAAAGGGFLEQALLAHGGVEVYRVPPEDYAGVARVSFDLTIFAGWLPDAWPAGSVLVVGPPEGTEAGGPGALPPAAGSFAPGPLAPAPGAEGHPVLRHVDWSEVHVARAQALALGEGWQPLVVAPGAGSGAPARGPAPGEPSPTGPSPGEPSPAGPGPDMASPSGPSPASPAAGGAGAAQYPLLAVQEEGGARRAVLAFALPDSDLPLRLAFPVLVANLIDWLVPRSPALAGELRPGVPVPLPPLPLAEALYLEDPGGQRQDLAPPWPPAPRTPRMPGLHRLVQVRAGGQQVVSLVPVGGYIPGESRIAPAAIPLPDAAAGARAAASPRPLWPWLAAAALILSFAEWWVDARGL
ncbi:MAG: VWA domain-containing protein [Bacillota bacterium]